MLPYILVAVGGYLIGQSRKDEKFSHGGDVIYKIEGSTFSEDLAEAKEHLGEEIWNNLSQEDRVEATKYLKAKGLIGFWGEEEDLADFSAEQYYASGGSLYRGMRPSPSISATAYPEGFKMVGNNGKMWKIVVNRNGVHRWQQI